jgi:hypothetical protein
MTVRAVTSLSAGSATAGARSYKWWGGALGCFCFLISIIRVGVKCYLELGCMTWATSVTKLCCQLCRGPLLKCEKWGAPGCYSADVATYAVSRGQTLATRQESTAQPHIRAPIARKSSADTLFWTFYRGVVCLRHGVPLNTRLNVMLMVPAFPFGNAGPAK